MSDPVRSIRVATALAERFRTLIGTGAGSTSELELAIGEADQVYPEMWRHLVDARNALAAMDRDVAEFDRLRRDELTHLGVTEIDKQAHVDTFALMQGSLRVAKVKVAKFNFAGYQSAVAASQALMAAMPEIDWGALARDEQRQIADAGSLHTRVWLAGVKWIVLAAAVIGASVVIYRVAMSGDGSADARPARARVVAPVVAPAAVVDLDPTPTAPARPICDDEVRAAITGRVAAAHGLAVDKKLRVRCEGVLVGDPAATTPALAVVLTVTTSKRHVRAVRGVTTVDGGQDLVPFAPAPAAVELIGVADLDRDGTDEIVVAGEKQLLVSRVVGGAFVDAAGPEMRGTCGADINIEGDFRNGQKGERKMLALYAGPENGPKCLAPGRHYYELVDGTLVPAR